MRTVRLLLVSLLLAFPLLSQAQQELFKKYSDMKNVSSVYISKAMLEMNPSLFTKDIYIGKAASQLNSVQIISTMDKMIKADLLKDIREMVKSSRYELLMKQKGTVSSSEFYVSRKGDKVRLSGRRDDDERRTEPIALSERERICISSPCVPVGGTGKHGHTHARYGLGQPAENFQVG